MMGLYSLAMESLFVSHRKFNMISQQVPFKKPRIKCFVKVMLQIRLFYIYCDRLFYVATKM